ncbi:phosphoribosyltransferase [bacterium]|nr:phosphoribosyltransferase [bacterium]MBU1650575.1 phosphoribosyltransferase [bacterium]MBU1880478.1 phosphoribosyltransferase [bacterium]
MQIQRLKDFRIASAASKTEGCAAPSCCIWLTGERIYKEILLHVYGHRSPVALPSNDPESFSWYVEIDDVSEIERREIREFLILLKRTLWISTELDACFALGWHSKSTGDTGKPTYTALGQWIHMAKSYGSDVGSKGDQQIALLIVEQMVEFIQRHPLYRSADGIISLLPSNTEKAYDLPSFLTEKIAEEVDIPYIPEALYKERRTAEMKFCLTFDDKLDNISGSVGAQDVLLKSKNLIVVDDIFDSGLTLAETCRALRKAGTGNLYGLIATKTLKRHFR